MLDLILVKYRKNCSDLKLIKLSSLFKKVFNSSRALVIERLGTILSDTIADSVGRSSLFVTPIKGIELSNNTIAPLVGASYIKHKSVVRAKSLRVIWVFSIKLLIDILRLSDNHLKQVPPGFSLSFTIILYLTDQSIIFCNPSKYRLVSTNEIPSLENLLMIIPIVFMELTDLY